MSCHETLTLDQSRTHLATRDGAGRKITACGAWVEDVWILTPRIALCDCTTCLVDVESYAPEPAAHAARLRLVELAEVRWNVAEDIEINAALKEIA